MAKYKKSSAKQKKFFFFLPSASIFAIFNGKVQKIERKTKEIFLFFAECQYLRHL